MEVDNIINTGEMPSFDRDMRIFKSDIVNFRFSERGSRANEANAAVEATVDPTASATVNLDAGGMFTRMMGNAWDIDRLETQIFHPTVAYAQQACLVPEVKSWIDKHKLMGAWKVYMVTGLMIARGATHKSVEASEKDVHGGGGAGASGIAKGKLQLRHEKGKTTEVSGEHPSDFVWAFRLSCAAKGLFSGDLETKPHTKGAVLAPGDENLDVNAILAGDDVCGDNVHTLVVVREEGDRPEQEILVTIDGL